MSRIPLSVPVMHGNEKKYLNECIDSGWVSSAGPWVDRFEKEFATAVSAPYAVSMTSGTAALHVALLVAGVLPGDEVIVPTLTFIASMNAVRYAGAEPIFFDCDENLNIDAAKIERFLSEECERRDGGTWNRKTGRRVSAMIPVHVFGMPARISEIVRIGDRHGIEVIEDAAESLGSYAAGVDGKERHTGTFARMGCFSFNGNKIITTGGGGMLVTADPEIAKKAKYLSTQAKDDEVFFVHGEVGYNYRLTSLQAALGIGQLEALPRIVERKREIHRRYTENFAKSGSGRIVAPPAGTRPNFWMNTFVAGEEFRVDLRKLIQALSEEGIQTRPIWKLNHEQKPYLGNAAYRIEFAPKIHSRALSLPSTSNLTDLEVDRVSEVLHRLVKKG